MDYEKKYKEAQGWIEKIYPTLQHEQQMEAEAFFPELAESEDERIRKAIINVFSTHKDYEMFFGASVEDIRTWLEKQGEQKPNYTTLVETGNGGINALVTRELSNSCDYEEKPAEKIEPKFQHGQWIVWQDKCYKVNYNGCGYELVDQNGLSTSLEYGTIDENAHIWDITKDAKDGDVIFDINHKNILLFRGILDGWVNVYCSVHEDDSCCINFNNKYGKYNTNFSPATKEQRDTLEKAMADAGYTFDFDKRELKKIEQKSTWSEEDEEILTSIIQDTLSGHQLDSMQIKWLKSLKERYTWKPSEEQMRALHDMNLTGNISYAGQGQTLIELYNDLKKLKG